MFCNSTFYFLFFFTPGFLVGYTIFISCYVHSIVMSPEHPAPPLRLKDFFFFFFLNIHMCNLGMVNILWVMMSDFDRNQYNDLMFYCPV